MTDVLSNLTAALADGALRIVDLTQTLSERTPVIELPSPFANSPGVSIKPISSFDELGPAWRWNALSFGEHTGTHFDAPGHWITGRDLPENTCDTVAPSRFIASACVIDVSKECTADDDYLCTPDRIAQWEAEHGEIAAGAWVLLRTDWSKRTDASSFLNIRDDGLHSPGFSTDAIKLLAHKRDVLGVGVETVGTDAGQAGAFDPPFPAHHILLGAGKLGLASLCNLDQLPATGAIVIAAPLKIEQGTGSPVRAFAMIPNTI